MWFFLFKAIAGAVIGDASAEWFKKTKFGLWFYAKVERVYNWAAKRYDIKIATVEEKQMKKFPNLTKRLTLVSHMLMVQLLLDYKRWLNLLVIKLPEIQTFTKTKRLVSHST